MERLTTRLPDGRAFPTKCVEHPDVYQQDGTDLVERLAEYEDAEEQGRLIELPVAKGSTVYYVPDYLYGQDSRVEELYVMGYRIFEDDSIYLRVKQTRYSGTLINIKRIGEDVFLIREEAQAKLKEMETENGQKRH